MDNERRMERAWRGHVLRLLGVIATLALAWAESRFTTPTRLPNLRRIIDEAIDFSERLL